MICNENIEGKNNFILHISEQHDFNLIWIFDNFLGGKYVHQEMENLKRKKKNEE